MGDLEQLLNTLDFNGAHCGDPLAAAYFREAAVALRVLERDRNHYQQVAAIERGKAYDAQRTVRQLSSTLDALRARADGVDPA